MMKRVNSLMIGALGALMAVAAVPAMAGIANTKHNLGTTGTGNNHLTTGTAEICVFCHTPHGSDTSAPVPLWNRKLGTSVTYTPYSDLKSSTLDAKTAVMSSSPSLACLSCHDGTQSMDSVINAPGSGGYNSLGQDMTGAVWTGATVNAAGVLQAGITLIGTDLRNDHPVSIQYAGGVNVASCGTGCGTAQFNDPDFEPIKAMDNNGTKYWWVEKNGNTTRERQDIILYTRSEANTGNIAQPFVECASCHDPHVEAKNANEVAFLRVSNAGSGLCLSCHVK